MTRKCLSRSVKRIAFSLGMAAALAVPANAALLDPGFELQGATVGAYCYFDTICPAGAWTGIKAGLQDENNLGFPGIATPDGAKYGFVQLTGSFSQTFVADASGAFRLSFLDAGRPRIAFSIGGDQTYDVLLDAVSLGTFTTTSSQPFSARLTNAFNLIAGQSYTLAFAGQSTSDNAAYIDALSFDAITAPPGVPEPASWALLIGGFGLAGAAARRRREQNFVTARTTVVNAS